LSIAVYTRAGIEAAEAAAARLGRTLDVHLKIDSGMHRVGADPPDVLDLAQLLSGCDHLHLGSVWTHLAVADGLDKEDKRFTATQLHVYDDALALLAASGIEVRMRHAANSAGAIAYPSARYDLVRCGIALYGELPVRDFAQYLEERGEHLLPVLSLKARIGQVRRLAAGERPSYGRKRALPEDSTVAVVPLGYADGVPRAWFDRQGTVLVGGRHRPLAGTVTMDQIVIDCGSENDVAVGDEVVLIGRQADASLSASDWADKLGTISYEVLCGIGQRVPRVVVDHGGGAEESMSAGTSAVRS
jgi:alanine racemase